MDVKGDNLLLYKKIKNSKKYYNNPTDYTKDLHVNTATACCRLIILVNVKILPQ